MSWIVVKQRQSTDKKLPPGETTYTVEVSVESAGGIPRELFVYNTSGAKFSSVALVRDIESWPAGRDAAIEQQLDFYRAADLERTFTRKETAAAFSQDVQRRLAIVNRDWDSAASTEFGGEKTFVYSTEDT